MASIPLSGSWSTNCAEKGGFLLRLPAESFSKWFWHILASALGQAPVVKNWSLSPTATRSPPGLSMTLILRNDLQEFVMLSGTPRQRRPLTPPKSLTQSLKKDPAVNLGSQRFSMADSWAKSAHALNSEVGNKQEVSRSPHFSIVVLRVRVWHTGSRQSQVKPPKINQNYIILYI